MSYFSECRLSDDECRSKSESEPEGASLLGRSLLAVVVTSLLMGINFLAFAQDGYVPPATRLPFVLLSIGIFLIGLFLASISKGWWELGKGKRILRVVGAVVASLGAAFLIYGVTVPPPSTSNQLNWLYQPVAAQAVSQETGKPIMVDFRADWCVACKELEADVFNHESVAPELTRDFVLLKVDMDEDTPENRAIADRFEVSGLPHVAFLSPDDQILSKATIVGLVDVPTFQQHMQAAKTGAEISKDDSFSTTLSEGGLVATLFTVFVAGLLASLTPCVYPLIPVTIGILGAREAKSKLDAFVVSLIYVLGIGVTYSSLGVTAAILGNVFGGAMQSPWVISGIAIIFFVLGLSSIGLFNISLPSGLQTKLSEKGGAGYIGAFVMGLVAGIIAAPCVGPIVAGVLVYVAQQQDILLGFILLFTFALGMGVLFILLGTFSGLLTRIPSGGGWMEGVKIVVGTVFIGVSLYYLSVLLPVVRGVADSLWLLVG